MRWSRDLRSLAAGTLLAALAPLLRAGEIPPGARAERRDIPVDAVHQKFPEKLAGVLDSGAGWLPYYVELRALRDRPVLVEIVGSVVQASDGSTVSTSSRRIEVAPGAPARTWLYLRYQGADELLEGRVKVLAEGTTQPLPSVNIYQGKDPGERQIRILLSGDRVRTMPSPWGTDSLLAGRETVSNTGVSILEEKELPDDPIGYHAVQLLLLRNPDVKALEPRQVDAILRWVFLGGWIILVPSPTGEIFKSPLLRELLPGARIDETPSSSEIAPGDLWSTDGSEWKRLASGAVKAGKAVLKLSSIDPVRAKGRREIVSAPAAPEGAAVEPRDVRRLYYEVGYGEGVVGILTIDDEQAPRDPREHPFRHGLWAGILGGSDSPAAARHSLRSDPEDRIPGQLAGNLRSALRRDFGVWFIASLVVLYILVIGPGLYFVLRRKGKLPSVVWVEPLVVLAYLGIIAMTAYATKGVLTRVRTVTVFESKPGMPFLVRRSVLGLFSADETAYRISAPGAEFIYPLAEGLTSRADIEFGGRDGPAVRNCRIPKWGTVTFAAREIRRVSPDSGISIEGIEGESPASDPVAAIKSGGARAVTVRNRTGFALRRLFLCERSGWICRLDAGAAGKGIPSGEQVRLPGGFPSLEIAAAIKGARTPGSPDPFDGDEALSALIRILTKSALPASRALIGVIERTEADFTVDQPSTLERRLDLFVEALEEP